MSSATGGGAGEKSTEHPASPQSLPPPRLQPCPEQAPSTSTPLVVNTGLQTQNQLWRPILSPPVAGVAASPAAGPTLRPFAMHGRTPTTPHQQFTSTLGMGVAGQHHLLSSGWQPGMVAPSWTHPIHHAGLPLQARTAPSPSPAGPSAPVAGSAAAPFDPMANSAAPQRARKNTALAEAAATDAFIREALGEDNEVTGSRDAPQDGSDCNGDSSAASNRTGASGAGDRVLEKRVDHDSPDAGASGLGLAGLADDTSEKPVLREGTPNYDSPDAGTSGLGLAGLVDDTSEKPVLRKGTPHYGRWPVGDLRAKAREVARNQKRRNLVFGDGPEDVLTSVSTAKRSRIAEAFIKLAAYLKARGEPQDYRHWAPVTPEKSNRKGKGKAKQVDLRKDSNLLARIMCLLGEPEFFDLYSEYNRSANRDAQDAKEVGSRHKFIRKLAAATVNPDWRNSNGNPISVPIDHKHDNPEAPLDLMEALDELDLVTPAILLLNSLEKDEKGEPDLTPVERALVKWIKAMTAEHKEMREREDRSGGVGTDFVRDAKDEDGSTQMGGTSGDDVVGGGGGSSAGTGGDGGGGSSADTGGDGGGGSSADTGGDSGGGSTAGTGGDGGGAPCGHADRERKDGIHTWNFCQGRLALMLWHDAMVVNANGDAQYIDIVMRPGHLGSKMDTDEVPAHESALDQTVKSEGGGRRKKNSRSKKPRGGGGDSWQEFTAIARSIEERNSRLEERELNLREHDAMLERQEVDPFAEVEKAAQAIEETRKRLEDLSPRASPSVRDALRLVLAKREKKLKACMKKLEDDESGCEPESRPGGDSEGSPGSESAGESGDDG